MPPSLTARQVQIILLIANGYDRESIAEELDIATSSVRSLIKELCARYDCRTHELPLKACADIDSAIG